MGKLKGRCRRCDELIRFGSPLDATGKLNAFSPNPRGQNICGREIFSWLNLNTKSNSTVPMDALNRDAEEVIAALRKASTANRSTPGRQGNVVFLNPRNADEVMITGDLHGRRDNFEAIVSAAALRSNPRRHLVLQEACHGGPIYTDACGCMSHALLEEIAVLKAEFPQRVHFLLGNHELSELTGYPIQKNRQMLNLLFRLGMLHKFGSSTEDVREAQLEFLRSSPLAVSLSNGIFISHSIPEKCDSGSFDAGIFEREISYDAPFAEDDVFSLLWGRDYREENARRFADLIGAKLLINGHDPCLEGYRVANSRQIILDCCGDKAGYLTISPGEQITTQQAAERVQILQGAGIKQD